MTDNDFIPVMAAKTDKQLIDILSIRKEEYQEEALVAAQAELEKRQLSISSVYSEEAIAQVRDSQIARMETAELDWYYKGLIVVAPLILGALATRLIKGNPALASLRTLPFGIVIFLQYYIHRLLKEKGYRKMAADFKNWVIYTYYIYIGLVILLGILIFALPH